MEAISDELEDDGDAMENDLLKGEPSPCVCCKIWEKDLVSGWSPSKPNKHSRKPAKARTLLGGNARKERNIPPAERRFVFRHYENSSQYIKQYRENHCSAFLESGDQWKPVLGVDFPDPYLPKTGSTSQALLDRLTFIEAMSDYYKVTKSAVRCDIKNICLTGKRTKPADNSKQGSDEFSPLTVSSPNETQDYQKVETRIHIKSSEGTRFDPGAKLQYFKTALNSEQDCALPSVPPQPDPPLHPQGSHSFGRTKDCPPNHSSRVSKKRVRLPKFQWTECRVKGDSKTPSEKYTIAMKAAKKADRSMVEPGQSTDTNENILFANRQLNSRGNLHLGSTVKSSASTSRQANFSVVKNDMLSWEARRKCPKETAFIRVLGHQTGLRPSEGMSTGNKDRTRTRETASLQHTNKNLSLQYLTGLRRRQFNLVLEARSFKPGEKKLGTTAVAEQN